MKRLFLLFWFASLVFNKSGYCQNGVFHVDEREILLNENLDFFLTKLKTDHFKILKKKNEIPNFIKEQLPWLNNKSIADPDEEFQDTDEIIDRTLPDRKIVFLAIGEDVFVAVYLKGGIGLSAHILFVKYANNRVSDVWVGFASNNNLNSIKDIQEDINANRKKEWGLNTNMVDY